MYSAFEECEIPGVNMKENMLCSTYFNDFVIGSLTMFLRL